MLKGSCYLIITENGILQKLVEPMEAKPKPDRRDEIITETIKDFRGIEDPDYRIERIQVAVLDKLKLND